VTDRLNAVSLKHLNQSSAIFSTLQHFVLAAKYAHIIRVLKISAIFRPNSITIRYGIFASA